MPPRPGYYQTSTGTYRWTFEAPAVPSLGHTKLHPRMVLRRLVSPAVAGRSYRWVRMPGGQAPALLATARLLSDAELADLGREIRACVRCGKPLSNPQSRRAGIGPECARRVDAR